MNDDLISRKAAIRWVKTECNPYGKPTLDFKSGKKVIEHLEQMPSASRNRRRGEWIPVDQKLPDNDEMMLVTCCTKKGQRSVNRAYYADGFWHGSGSMSGVTAWRALPEPYEGE